MMVGIRFDLRVPAFATVTHAEQYAACLDFCEWADRFGFDAVVLSEHHGVDDGYMSAPLVIAAAIAGRTRRLRINIAAILLPLHDPIRLAEQVAAVDLLSGGRLSFVAGLGYRHEEFDMAAVERSQRTKLLEEYMGVLQQAWTGEEFTWRGRRVRVTPRPSQPPRVMLGGSTEKAARMAARLRAGFSPAIGDPALADAYNDECAKQGFAQGFVALPSGPGFIHISEDPDRDWQHIAPHAVYDAQTYAEWQTKGQRSQMHVDGQSADEVRRSGVYRVVTPEECVELANQNGRILLHPLMGGLAPDLARQSLDLFAARVLPRIRPAT